MPRLTPTTLRPRISRSSPRRKPPPHVPNRAPWFPTSTPPPNRPPTLQAFRSVLSRTRPVSTHGFHGSRSYLRRHGVQFRRAHISYHKTAFAVYLKITANRLRKHGFYNGSAGPVPNHFKTYPHLHSRAKRGRRTTQLKISAPSTPQREISTAD